MKYSKAKSVETSHSLSAYCFNSSVEESTKTIISISDSGVAVPLATEHEIMLDKERTDTQLATLFDLRLQIKKDTKETYTKDEILEREKTSLSKTLPFKTNKKAQNPNV